MQLVVQEAGEPISACRAQEDGADRPAAAEKHSRRRKQVSQKQLSWLPGFHPTCPHSGAVRRVVPQLIRQTKLQASNQQEPECRPGQQASSCRVLEPSCCKPVPRLERGTGHRASRCKPGRYAQQTMLSVSFCCVLRHDSLAVALLSFLSSQQAS